MIPQSDWTSYVCGGSILVSPDREDFPTDEGPIVSSPVVVRWDGDNNSKMQFPPDQSSDLTKLLAYGQPATFGQGGKDVLDESYRKAVKLDESAFSTNFHPNGKYLSLYLFRTGS